MNTMLEELKGRRSIRSYKPEMPPKEEIEKIIEAGLFAASGMGKQSSMIIVVTDEKLRDRLMEMNRRILGAPEGTDPFYGAPVVLVVLGDSTVPYTVADGSLVMGNLMQAAYASGLGSCWINRAKEEFESEDGKRILKELGIEGEWTGIGHCIIGYIDGEVPAPAPRKAGRVVWVE